MSETKCGFCSRPCSLIEMKKGTYEACDKECAHGIDVLKNIDKILAGGDRGLFYSVKVPTPMVINFDDIEVSF